MNPWGIFAFIGICILVYKMIAAKVEKDIIDAQADDFEDVEEDPDFAEVPPFLEVKKLPPSTDVFDCNTVPGQNGLFFSRPTHLHGVSFESTLWNGEKWTYQDGKECYLQSRVWYGLTEKV